MRALAAAADFEAAGPIRPRFDQHAMCTPEEGDSEHTTLLLLRVVELTGQAPLELRQRLVVVRRLCRV